RNRTLEDGVRSLPRARSLSTPNPQTSSAPGSPSAQSCHRQSTLTVLRDQLRSSRHGRDPVPTPSRLSPTSTIITCVVPIHPLYHLVGKSEILRIPPLPRIGMGPILNFRCSRSS